MSQKDRKQQQICVYLTPDCEGTRLVKAMWTDMRDDNGVLRVDRDLPASRLVPEILSMYPNHLKSGAKIFFMSDPSHFLKKVATPTLAPAFSPAPPVPAPHRPDVHAGV